MRLIAKLLLAASWCVCACARAEEDPSLLVGFLIEDGIYGSELVAPFDILHHTRFHVQPGMKVLTIARSREPVTTFEGLKLDPDLDYASAPALDVIVVPSAERHVNEAFDDPELIGFLKQRAPAARFIMSLCDGAFVLAKAGLLDGKTCTTFPGDIPRLREQYPRVRVIDGVSFVVDGKLITSAGGARSYDPALYLVERIYGETPAINVARGLVIDWSLNQVAHYFARENPNGAYDAGDRIDPDVSVEDAEGGSHRLLSLCAADDQVLVLFVFGGGGTGREIRRAGLWCEDSMNEMPLMRHMQARFEDRPVAFLPVACPPFLDEQQFGHAAGGFLPDSPDYAKERASFVEATLKAVEEGVIPFSKVYFDISLRLLRNTLESPPTGTDPAWLGRFRARDEVQKYGTPTLWILSREGQVLMPPLHGNHYEKNLVLNYTARELSFAIERALEIVADD